MASNTYSQIVRLLGIILFFMGVFNSVSHGEITLDGSLGPGGALSGPDYVITDKLGRQAGRNLFHSFGLFNVNTHESATFTGPNTVENIIGRVTGGSASWIDGRLGSAIQGADLYLINPSGVMFGPNATLDVSGSFHVTTADFIRLGETGRFDATHPDNTILTTDPPSAFGFLDNDSASISIEGSFLQVPQKKTLSVVGGDFTMQNATLYAPEGRINIASVASTGEVIPDTSDLAVDTFDNLGTINISNSSGKYLEGDATSIANLDVSGSSAGTIFIRGGRFMSDGGYVFADTFGNIDSDGKIDLDIEDLTLTNGAWINTGSYGAGQGGDVRVKAGGSVSISGFAENSEGNVFPSGLFSIAGGEGNGGNISLDVEDLSLANGAWISTDSYGAGQGGDVRVTAKKSVAISRFAEDSEGYVVPSGIYSFAKGEGGGGDISMDVEDLGLTNGAWISTNSYSAGQGGKVTVTAGGSVAISGFAEESEGTVVRSSIYSFAEGEGNAGNISLDVETLTLTEGAEITTSTFGPGKVGELTVTAGGSVAISGFAEGSEGNVVLSGIFSTAIGEGNAGNISLDVENLSLTEGARINTSSLGSAKGGDLAVTAKKSVAISGFAEDSQGNVFPSGLFSVTGGEGNAGNISLDVEALTLTESAQINTSSLVAGKGGDVTVKAGGSVSISGFAENCEGNIVTSGILSVTRGEGNAGNISLDVEALTLSEGAQINTSSDGAGQGGDVTVTAQKSVSISGGAEDSEGNITSSGVFSRAGGEGNAGNISLDVEELTLTDGARINTSSDGAGQGGDVTVTAQKSVSISGFAEDSQGNVFPSGIFNRAGGEGNAGNISLDVEDLTLTDGARINARSYSAGQGGDVRVTAKKSVSISGFAEESEGYVVKSGILSDASGEGNAGNIFLDVEELTLTNGAQISTSSYGTGQGGDVTVTAGGSVSISGFVKNIEGYVMSSGIFSRAIGEGDAGNIFLDVETLTLTDGAQINTTTFFGAGQGGEVRVAAKGSVSISGFAEGSQGYQGYVFESGILSEAGGVGNAGNISLDVEDLTLTNGAQIDTSSLGAGQGGDVTVTAGGSVAISGFAEDSQGDIYSSGIFSDTGGEGNAGNISLDVEELTLTNGAQIDTTTLLGSGEGGDVTVTAGGSVAISGFAKDSEGYVFESGIFSDTGDQGNAGNISLDVEDLTLTNGAWISASTIGAGEGGDVTVTAKGSVSIAGGAEDGSDGDVVTSGLFSGTSGTGSEGNAGNISLDVEDLTLTNGGQINTTSRGIGKGGKVTVTAKGSVSISGFAEENKGYIFPSGLFSATVTEGLGGKIQLKAQKVMVEDSGMISAESRGSGNAGDISIEATDLLYYEHGFLRTSADQADSGGNIFITGDDIQLTDNSEVTASVALGKGDGGNVEINASTLVALEDSDITARANEGYGGNIKINAQVVLFSDDIDLDASSDIIGQEGTVEVNSPDVEISGFLVPLRASFLGAEELLPQRCETRDAEDVGSFVIEGRGGLPPKPDSLLPSP